MSTTGIDGEQAYLAALARTRLQAPRALDRALIRSAGPTLVLASSIAPRERGRLAGSGSVESRPGEVGLVFGAEHAPILELFERGRFRRLTSKYGPPGRFAERAIDRREERIVDEIDRDLDPVITFDGWAG